MTRYNPNALRRKSMSKATPLPVAPMPKPLPGRRWRKDARREWSALFESGTWSRLDASQRLEAERLVQLVDELSRTDAAVQRRLLGESCRRSRNALGLNRPEPHKPPDDSAKDDQRAVARAERAADPEHPSNWTELTGGEVAKVELSPLVSDTPFDYATPAGRREAIEAYDEAAQRGLSVLG